MLKEKIKEIGSFLTVFLIQAVIIGLFVFQITESIGMAGIIPIPVIILNLDSLRKNLKNLRVRA